jgi:phosphate uptake regulator
LNEAEEAKNAAEAKLKSLNTQKLEMLTDSEAKFKQREQELEKLIEEKEEEIDNLIQES